jgi:hypothetical protein
MIALRETSAENRAESSAVPEERAILALAVAQLRATADTLSLLLTSSMSSSNTESSPRDLAVPQQAAEVGASTGSSLCEEAGLAEHLLRLKLRQA